MHGPTREAVETLREDGERGSEAISQDALAALADHLEAAPAKTADELRGSTRRAARQLAEARPAMRVVASKVAAAWRRVTSAVTLTADLATLRSQGVTVVRDLVDEAADARRAAAETGREVLAEATDVVTLSDSSTTRRVFTGLDAAVHVLESRPGGEGLGFAGELRKTGVDVDVAPDAYASGLLEAVEADAVVFGADGVARDGSVLNKVGSRTLAAAAREADVPVWVVTSTWKCAPGPAPGEAAAWSPDEAPGVDVPLFEATPPALVDGLATERGPLQPREAAEVAGQRAADLADLGLDVG